MGIDTEEDVQVLASYFVKHRAAAGEADAGSETVREAYLLYYFPLWNDTAKFFTPFYSQSSPANLHLHGCCHHRLLSDGTYSTGVLTKLEDADRLQDHDHHQGQGYCQGQFFLHQSLVPVKNTKAKALYDKRKPQC